MVRADISLEKMSGADVHLINRVAKWGFSMKLPPMKQTTARVWRSRLVQLAQGDNYFEASPPDHNGAPASGYAGAAPVIKGTGQLGFSIACDGVTPSATILLEGDYIQIGTELKILTADAVADGSGNVTLSIYPPQRSAPTDNASTVIANPKAKFKFIENVAQWDIVPHMIYEMTLNAIETY
jgi:hypothetical protein